MLTAEVRETQSGDRLAEVELAPGSSWGHGDGGERRAGIILHDKYSRSQWRDLLTRWYDRILLFLWDGVPIAEGFITDAPTYDRRRHIVTVTHSWIPTILDRRWMHGVGPSTGGGGYVPSGEFAVSGVSIAGAVVEVLQRAYLDPISAAWPIPVQLPAVGSGSFSKRWKFHQFQTAAAIIKDLTVRDDGPQMDLRPMLQAGKLTRVQRVGTLTGPTFDVFLDADESAADDAGFGMHGKATATGVHLPGKGSDEGMRVGSAANPVSAGLARDTIFWNKTEPDVGRLSAQARGRLNALRTMTRRPLTVKASLLSPADLRVGSIINIHSEDQLWEDTTSSVRVVGFSGGMGETYTIETVEA
ncbi:hypothetical protein [Microbacterium dauci]|uniref:Minor tail protein n=1 Tax=Microbacterium dauci TaxID=3048008 RepID=A0ABT6ZAQ2_9MICO|nr:hypothetical protein [Microbacterium sp. LX3-4]MDJ1113242.1 hypothetical protein [Microbacterium sp. LX3-4]